MLTDNGPLGIKGNHGYCSDFSSSLQSTVRNAVLAESQRLSLSQSLILDNFFVGVKQAFFSHIQDGRERLAYIMK